MTSVVLYRGALRAPSSLAQDLQDAAIAIAARVDEAAELVRTVARCAPDVLVCEDDLLDDSLLAQLQALAASTPCAVLLLTGNSHAEPMALALDSGVHCYVANGYQAARLRALLQQAQARFVRERRLLDELAAVRIRLEERKFVDRAKGILMRARQVSDEEAFEILRSTSMHASQRLGQVSRHVIQSAAFAELVNRAGQLRMLSQQLIVLHLLRLSGLPVEVTDQRLARAMAQVQDNLAFLQRQLSAATFGDLLQQVLQAWGALEPQLRRQAATEPAQVGAVDAGAEALLQAAEQLTHQLESAGGGAPLAVLNLAARQRMLSQRYTKLVLLAWLHAEHPGRAQAGAADALEAARTAFDAALAQMGTLPLRSKAIKEALANSVSLWATLQAQAAAGASASSAQQLVALQHLAATSAALLEASDQLAQLYEHSMQLLLGA